MIDDVSLMDVAARGSTNLVLDFLHYCHTLVSEFVSNQLKLLFVFSVCNTFTQFSYIYHYPHFVVIGMFLSHAQSRGYLFRHGEAYIDFTDGVSSRHSDKGRTFRHWFGLRCAWTGTSRTYFCLSLFSSLCSLEIRNVAFLI